MHRALFAITSNLQKSKPNTYHRGHDEKRFEDPAGDRWMSDKDDSSEQLAELAAMVDRSTWAAPRAGHQLVE